MNYAFDFRWIINHDKGKGASFKRFVLILSDKALHYGGGTMA